MYGDKTIKWVIQNKNTQVDRGCESAYMKINNNLKRMIYQLVFILFIKKKILVFILVKIIGKKSRWGLSPVIGFDQLS